MVTSKSKGQGFGLAVVERLTEAMHGDVTYKSEKGKGTKFTLTFSYPKMIGLLKSPVNTLSLYLELIWRIVFLR